MRQRSLLLGPELILRLGVPVLMLVAVGGVMPANGDFMIHPSGLGVGDPFQLAFVTSGVYPAKSSDIADYNSLVTAAAVAAGLDTVNGQAVTWQVIGTTATVDARDNAPQTVSVYDLQGHLITGSAGGLWSTSFVHGLDHPINVSESGVNLTGSGVKYVWTGSRTDGTYQIGLGLGATVVTLGDLTSVTSMWINASGQYSNFAYHLYALSSPVLETRTIPLPGPGAGYLTVVGLLSLWGWKAWWQD